MLVQLEFRADTIADWTAANPVLAKGEPGFETDTGRFRIGDGVTPFLNLGVQTADVSLFTTLTDEAVAAAVRAEEAAAQAVEIVGVTSSATETTLGVVQYATPAEAIEGTLPDRVVSPATMSAAIDAAVSGSNGGIGFDEDGTPYLLEG